MSKDWKAWRKAFENRIIDDSIRLSIEFDEEGWVSIYQYDAKSTEWKELGRDYWFYRDEFLRDIEKWHGKNAVPEYEAALAVAPIWYD